MLREAKGEEIKAQYNANTRFNRCLYLRPQGLMCETEIGALIGLSQLKRLDHMIARRNENFVYF